MPDDKSDLLQGTLDMLILKVVALGPIHGYGISQRIRQISKDVLQVQQAPCHFDSTIDSQGRFHPMSTDTRIVDRQGIPLHGQTHGDQRAPTLR